MSFCFCYLIDPKRAGSRAVFRNNSVTSRAGARSVRANDVCVARWSDAPASLVVANNRRGFVWRQASELSIRDQRTQMSIVTTYLEMRSPDRFAQRTAQMNAFKSGRRKKPTGGSIAISILPSVSAGRGLISDRGPMSSGRNTGSPRSCGHLVPTMATRSQVITNCVATTKAGSRSHTSDCCQTFLVAGSAGRCSRARSRKRGGCRLQSPVFGSTPAHAIIPGRWPTTRPGNGDLQGGRRIALEATREFPGDAIYWIDA